MSIIVDLVIVAFILLCIFLGYRKGLTASLLSIISFVLALVISLVLYKPVSNMIIANTQIDEKLENSIHNVISNSENELQEDIKKQTEKFERIPKVLQEYINEAVETVGTETTEIIANAISQKITIEIIEIGVLICLFIILRIVLIFIKGLTKLITKIPVIKQFDKLGGIIYGVIKALIVIYVILAIMSLVSPLLRASKVIDGINKSILGSMLYNNNLILKLFM